MNIAYNSNIPNAPNNPSADQPLMQTNTNSISTWTTIDHFGFQDNAGGWHKQVSMPSGTYTLGAPPTSTFSQMVLFTALTGTPLSSVLAYTKDNSGVSVQLTGTFNPTTTTGPVGIGTFSSTKNFLPGGFIMQYGYVTAPSSGNPVTYPVTFPTAVLSLNLSILVFGATSAHYVCATASTTSGFSFQSDVSLSSDIRNVLYWTAIGN